MKKITAILLCAALTIGLLVSCGKENSDMPDTSSVASDVQGVLDNINSATAAGEKETTTPGTYNYTEFMTPVWEGETSYAETVFMLQKDGGLPEAQLLYTPEKVLKVQSPDLTETYEEGRDYTIEGRTIRLTENSRAPYMTEADMYPESPRGTDDSMKVGGGYLALNLPNGKHFCEMQLAVTYTHKETGFENFTPSSYGDKTIPKTLQKLQNGEDLNIIIYGDSIGAGAETSGFWKMKPNVPSWSRLINLGLMQLYPDSRVTMTTVAEGGTATQWGVDNAKERVASKKPDLVFITFGMGDAHAVYRLTPEQFGENYQKMIDIIRETSPDTEFVLMSTMLANPEAEGFTGRQAEYLKPLQEIERANTGVAVANVTEANSFILSRKKFWDVSGNGVNHPGDYMTRVYAQCAMQIFIKPE